MNQAKVTVAPDRMSATYELTDYPESSDKPSTGKYVTQRIGNPPAGMHAISGSWKPQKVDNVSENALLTTFEEISDSLKMTLGTGEHFDAKIDGKEYPFEKSAVAKKVVLKRLEETNKRADGRIEETLRMTVSADGRTLTMVNRDHQRRVATVIFNKQ